jgi:hypothetical protein
MKWYHFSVEYFEDLRNVNHCEFLIMRKKEADRKEKDKSMPSEKIAEAPQSPITIWKKWGGCPNGCDHGRSYTKRDKTVNGTTNGTHLNGKEARPGTRRLQSYSEDEDDPRGRAGPPKVDVQKSLDEVVSSPDGTPSYISVEGRLRPRLKSPHNIPLLQAGRDFGGSASGRTSLAESDNEASMDEVASKPSGRVPSLRKAVKSFHESGMGRGAKADALGDQSDVGSDGEGDDEDSDLLKEEAADKSIRGSVY